MNFPRRHFVRARVRHVGGVMNRTESAYNDILVARQRAGEVLWVGFERITLKLADDTRYTPDFAAVNADGSFTFVEVKGFLRDDARVKFKVAAEQFPWAHFLMVRKKAGAWETVYES